MVTKLIIAIHFIMFKNMESLCCAPETNIVSHINFGPPQWLSGKASSCNAGAAGGVGWIPGMEDPLEEGMAAHSSTLACRIPWTEEPGGLQSCGRKELDTTDVT